jgi:ferritin-like metal-binding protein YciE
MRDILKFKIPPAPNASNIPQAAAEPTKEQIRKLDAVAERILMSQQSYTPQEVQQLMEAMLKISSERAATGLQKMIDFGAIQMTGNGMYYLRDSTPF